MDPKVDIAGNAGLEEATLSFDDLGNVHRIHLKKRDFYTRNYIISRSERPFQRKGNELSSKNEKKDLSYFQTGAIIYLIGFIVPTENVKTRKESRSFEKHPMKNPRVVIGAVFFILYAFFYLGGSLESCGTDLVSSSVTIDRFDADIVIDSNGDMTVVETWDINYLSDMNVRFRDIEYKKYGDDYPLYASSANRASFDETAVSVKVFKDSVDRTGQVRVGYSWENDRDELGYLITCDPYSTTCESIFTDVSDAGGLSGLVRFEYTYKIIGAVTEYSDISELNWRLFEYVEGKVKNSEVTIHLPANAHPDSDILAWGHGLSQGTVEMVGNNQINLKMSNIAKGEYIEFRILAPTDLFPGVDAINTVIHPDMNRSALVEYEQRLADQTNLRITVAQIVFYGSIAVLIVMAGITYSVYRRLDKEYTPAFQGDYYRDLPSDATPAEMSYLFYMKKINDEDLTATLLDLIRRKFVAIDYEGQDLTSKNADFTLRRIPDADTRALKDHEKLVLTWFFDMIGGGNTVTTEQIEKYGKKGYTYAEKFEEKAREFVRVAKHLGELRGGFESNADPSRRKAFVFAVIPAGMAIIGLLTAGILAINNTLSIILSALIAITYVIYVSTIQRRTVAGNEEYVKWKAFKNFLENFGNMKDYPIPGVIVWEHYLVYATSLKCADKVMEQLKVRLPQTALEDSEGTFMTSGYRHTGFYYGFMFGRFQRSISVARSNVRQTIVAHNQSKAGGFGRGGGFGGGSSFGGGGGGGRSR